MSGVDTVEAEVRELVRRRGLDPVEDRLAVRRLVDEVVAEYDERSLTSTLPALSDVSSVARSVYDAVAGFGPLQRHLDDPEVEEIWVNRPDRVFVARRGRSELTTTILSDSLLCTCQAADAAVGGGVALTDGRPAPGGRPSLLPFSAEAFQG